MNIFLRIAYWIAILSGMSSVLAIVWTAVVNGVIGMVINAAIAFGSAWVIRVILESRTQPAREEGGDCPRDSSGVCTVHVKARTPIPNAPPKRKGYGEAPTDS